MLTYKLDTTFCIRGIRDRPKSAKTRYAERAATLCISMVTMAELLHGAEKSMRPVEGRQQVMDVAARIEVLDHDLDAAAVSMGWRGGAARAAAMPLEARAEIARKKVVRWSVRKT